MHLATGTNHSLNETLVSSVDVSSISDSSSSDNPSLEFAALTLSPTRENDASLNSERARKLKALPGCVEVKDSGNKSMAQWRKSFELARQEYLFQDLQLLENLKKKTNGHLIQSQFEAVVNFSKGVKSGFAEFQAIRKRFDTLASAKDTTVPQQIQAIKELDEDLTNNLAKLGKSADVILNCHTETQKFQTSWVKNIRDKINAILNAEFDQQDSIQFWLDFLKDGERAAPKIKVDPSGLATCFLEIVGKLGVLHLTKRCKKKWLGSKIIQGTYEAEKSKIDALDQKLKESKDTLTLSHRTWLFLIFKIYEGLLGKTKEAMHVDPAISFVVIANALDKTEGKLLTIIELTDEFLAEITQYYGVELSTWEAKGVCSRIPNIFTALELLLSAKEVVTEEYQDIYEEHIHEVCRATLEHFEKMKDLHWNCPNAAKKERRAAFLKDDFPKFQQGVFPRMNALTDIAHSHISQTKSKEAYKKRLKDDNRHGDSAWARPGRVLVTSEEILWALYKAIDALMLIQMISGATNAPTDPNSIGAEDAPAELEWLKMSIEMKNEFYAVLFTEIGKLRILNERSNERSKSDGESEPTSPFSRLRQLMTRTKHSPPVISVH